MNAIPFRVLPSPPDRPTYGPETDFPEVFTTFDGILE